MKKFWQGMLQIAVGIGVCTGLSVVISENLNAYFFTVLMYAGINVTLAVSLNLVNGLTGQFSMGHAGFMAVGGYVAASITTLLVQNHNLLGLPVFLSDQLLFFIALLAGGLVAAFLGYIVGLPSLRLKGDYLAIVTLGFGEIIRVLILNVDTIGGARGMPGIPKYSTFGWVYSVALITIIVITRLMRSSHGRALLAVREDEIAAEAMGVNTTQYKVKAFMLGAFFAGVAGGLFAHFLTYLNPATFDFNRSFEIITMVVLGGMGSTSGAVLAALFLTALRELLRPLQEITKLDFRMVIYAFMLVVLMLNRPNGFFGTKELSDLKWFKRLRKTRNHG